MFLGVSHTHSSLVSCVLNLQTGYVSPYYHVVIDDLFTTVPPNADQGGLFDVAEFDATTWKNLLENGHKKHLDKEGLASAKRHDRQNPPSILANKWLNPVEHLLGSHGGRHAKRNYVNGSPKNVAVELNGTVTVSLLRFQRETVVKMKMELRSQIRITT
ncbi:unnamed protein product [Cylindrotheca closterium]|uniref:Uncharacterized protein n=1 Tax=Cylindrotheca closterium TaxID=2856 RepID=A0AAD2CS77_9STRA|nr:unnamed protein product [Cylindrotheca closterium]